MTRIIRDWTPERVDDTPVAPHRFRWDDDRYTPEPASYREVREGSPYQPGDVVYVVYGDGYIRARVLAVFPYRDRNDDWAWRFRVQRETKAGYWSKLYTDTWPGYIQRGYQRAGLAPEMPTE